MKLSINQDIPVGLTIQQAKLKLGAQTNGTGEPLVSFVIPTYNHAAYLADAIQSIRAQDYSNIEIIVVDDGSTDNTKDVAARFADQIEYIWQHNRGLSAARNTGIAAATGTYIGVLDADDMLEPDYCSRLVSALTAFPDAEGIICGYRFVDQENRPLPQVETRCIPSKRLQSELLNGNYLVPESILLHRRCYENVGPFDVSLSACEDWDMWLRITESHKIISTERILARHRVLPGSMSADPKRMLTNRLEVLRKHVGDEPSRSDDGPLTRRGAYGHAYFTSALEYSQIDDHVTAAHFMRKAATIYPELLIEVETFYELGCSNQTKGRRGYLADLDVMQSAHAVNQVLDDLINQSNELNLLPHRKLEVCAVAYWALSLLAYGSGNLAKTRHYLTKVIRYAPSSITNREYLGLVARSILGEAGISNVKRFVLRQRQETRSGSSAARA